MFGLWRNQYGGGFCVLQEWAIKATSDYKDFLILVKIKTYKFKFSRVHSSRCGINTC